MEGWKTGWSGWKEWSRRRWLTPYARPAEGGVDFEGGEEDQGDGGATRRSMIANTPVGSGTAKKKWKQEETKMTRLQCNVAKWKNKRKSEGILDKRCVNNNDRETVGEGEREREREIACRQQSLCAPHIVVHLSGKSVLGGGGEEGVVRT